MVDDSSRQAFDTQMRLILSTKNPEECTVLPFIERRLAQFNLSESVTAIDILNEAYLRGVRLIDNGKHIDNPLAWIRVTSYNIIREYSRESKKNFHLEESMIGSPTDYNLLNYQDINTDLEMVLLALEKLDEVEKEILRLKIIEQLKWKEILQVLKQKGIIFKSEAALRKRKERALEQLSRNFDWLSSQNG